MHSFQCSHERIFILLICKSLASNSLLKFRTFNCYSQYFYWSDKFLIESGMLFFYLFWLSQKYRLYSNRNATDMKNVYFLTFHPLVLACLNINNQDYCKILGSWLNLISLLASQMIYCSPILLIPIFLVTKAPYPVA